MFEAASLYKFGRLEFDRLIIRAAGYRRGELLAELDERGRLTGNIIKPVVWGATKAAAVRPFCGENDVALQHSYFYADGDEDAASMTLVGCPRPVNPRSGLAAAAAAHGWPVMCLASCRRGPVRRLRHLAGHVLRQPQ